MFQPDKLVRDARTGRGHCEGCPAHESGRSECVNPGLFDPTANVVFVTIEPSHRFDWDQYEGWSAYNEVFSQKFAEKWPGGSQLQELLSPLPLDLEETWMTDAIKCPPVSGRDDEERAEAFNHCRNHLVDELDSMDADVVVTLGNRAASRTLRALGRDVGTVRTSRNCGRRFDTEPAVIVSTHWSNGWLGRTTTSRWGDDWAETQPELSGLAGAPYRDTVRASLAAELGFDYAMN